MADVVDSPPITAFGFRLFVGLCVTDEVVGCGGNGADSFMLVLKACFN